MARQATEPLVSLSNLPWQDQAVADAEGDHRRLGNATPAIGLSSHIARPDTSKMLTFRPALDVASARKRQLDAGQGGQEREDKAQLPVMIPKCLQDLLAVLPSRPVRQGEQKERIFIFRSCL